jgi:hypothetical protein
MGRTHKTNSSEISQSSPKDAPGRVRSPGSLLPPSCSHPSGSLRKSTGNETSGVSEHHFPCSKVMSLEDPLGDCFKLQCSLNTSPSGETAKPPMLLLKREMIEDAQAQVNFLAPDASAQKMPWGFIHQRVTL